MSILTPPGIFFRLALPRLRRAQPPARIVQPPPRYQNSFERRSAHSCQPGEIRERANRPSPPGRGNKIGDVASTKPVLYNTCGINESRKRKRFRELRKLRRCRTRERVAISSGNETLPLRRSLRAPRRCLWEGLKSV